MCGRAGNTGVWIVVLGLFLLVEPVAAQRAGEKPAVFDGVGVDEQLGSYIPRDLVFYNEAGDPVTLDAYFQDGQPVLLNLVYHDCPMLCNLLLDGLTASLKQLAWTPGEQFRVLTVSFNAIETPELARRQKARYLEELGRPEAASGWHFLTGEQASIDALTRAVGFEHKWVEEKQQFAHPAVLVFLSGDGKITRYLYGLEVASRDLRTALVEASEGKVGTVVDQFILYCFQYDPSENSYVLQATNIMKLGGLLTVLALGAMLFVFWRRERRKVDQALTG